MINWNDSDDGELSSMNFGFGFEIIVAKQIEDTDGAIITNGLFGFSIGDDEPTGDYGEYHTMYQAKRAAINAARDIATWILDELPSTVRHVKVAEPLKKFEYYSGDNDE